MLRSKKLTTQQASALGGVKEAFAVLKPNSPVQGQASLMAVVTLMSLQVGCSTVEQLCE
jgi:hypothetical protein